MKILIPIRELDEFAFDWEFYAMMGDDITTIFKSEVIPPFCYRPLVPFLVYLLPFEIEVGFLIINFLSLYCIGIAFYFTLRLFFDKRFSAIGLLFLCYIDCATLSWCFFGMYLWSNYLVDPLALLFLILCFYSIFTSKRRWFAILLALGTLTKEIVLFSIPIFICYSYFNNDREKSIKTLITHTLKLIPYIIPGILAFFGVRLLTQPAAISDYPLWYNAYNGADYFSIGMILVFVKFRVLDFFQGYGVIFYTIGVWGPIIIVFALYNKKGEFKKLLQNYGLFYLVVCSQFLLGRGRGRFSIIMFFPTLFLALKGLENASSENIKLFWVVSLMIFIQIGTKIAYYIALYP